MLRLMVQRLSAHCGRKGLATRTALAVAQGDSGGVCLISKDQHVDSEWSGLPEGPLPVILSTSRPHVQKVPQPPQIPAAARPAAVQITI